MPRIVINKARNMDPSVGLPSWAENHVLTLCDRHVTHDTWRKIRNDQLPECYGGLYVLVQHLIGQPYEEYVVYFDDGTDIGQLPQDLQECIVFAASWGFNAIQFEPAEPEGMQPISQLKIYS